MLIRLAQFILPLIVMMSISQGANAQWTDEYDGHFIKYSKRYFGPYFDWRWFKTQAIIESNLRPAATSHVGARGVMQIMPATYAEIKDRNPHFGTLDTPRWNIAAGIYYNRLLFRKWNDTLNETERLYLTFASYNAGLGRIRVAYRRSPKPVLGWADIAPQAPSETRGYIRKIRALRMDERMTRVALKNRGIAAKLQRRLKENES